MRAMVLWPVLVLPAAQVRVSARTGPRCPLLQQQRLRRLRASGIRHTHLPMTQGAQGTLWLRPRRRATRPALPLRTTRGEPSSSLPLHCLTKTGGLRGPGQEQAEAQWT